MVVLFIVTACSLSTKSAQSKVSNREIILMHDHTDPERNRLLKEDFEYLKKELPKRHKNLFFQISKKEFNASMDQIIKKIDTTDNKPLFTMLNQVLATVGDAHTTINYWDGYHYPLQFYLFQNKVYIVDADVSLKSMLFSEVEKIDGVDMDTIKKELTTLIPHENENWVSAMLPGYLQSPVYMFGLGILKQEEEAVFTVQKDGEVREYTVPSLSYGEEATFVGYQAGDAIVGNERTYYSCQYDEDNSALYFAYNVCADMPNQSFEAFNKKMFQSIEEKKVERIIVDLRSNTGGNSEVLNPFTKQLKNYCKKNKETKVYILVGRNTFSSGMFAIYRIKDAVPASVSVGEPTGGALDCYGEIKTLSLPNSKLPISYSTKYFTFSKSFHYKNDGIGTFLPDITLSPSILDFRGGKDIVLQYALEH